jgi:hypothetical protein
VCHDSGGLRKKGFGEDAMRRVVKIASLPKECFRINYSRLQANFTVVHERTEIFEAYSLQIKPL